MLRPIFLALSFCLLLASALATSGCSDEATKAGDPLGADAGSSNPEPDAAALGQSEFLTNPDEFAIAEEAYKYQSIAVIPMQAQIVYELRVAPEGMTIDSTSGVVEWQPTPDQPGPHDVIITASAGGTSIQQEYIVQVAVPRHVISVVVNRTGGVIEGAGLRIEIPPDAVSVSTTLTLSVLEGPPPPMWEEMHLMDQAFILRSNTDQKEIAATVERQVSDIPDENQVFLAASSQAAHFGIGGDVVVIHPTTALSAETIKADLTRRSHYFDLGGWSLFTQLKVTLYSEDGFVVGWVHGDMPNPEAQSISERTLANLLNARSTVRDAMGCDAPDDTVVYIASFTAASNNVLGFVSNRIMHLNKNKIEELPGAHQTLNHEYMHIVQSHMIDSDRLGWWAEPTAEHGAEQITNANLSHTTFGAMDEYVAIDGFADKGPFQKYKLYIYYRFLHETTGFKVCELLRRQKRVLQDNDINAAMFRQMGMEEFPRSFLDFTEAYYFFRDASSFGDDAPGIASFTPPQLTFSEGEAEYYDFLYGGSGVQINRTSTQAQTLKVSIEGGLADNGLLGVIRDEDKNLLGEFSGAESEVFLKNTSASTLYVSLSQKNMYGHDKDEEFTVIVREALIVVENKSGKNTNEEGDEVTFDVTLAANPGEDITVSVSSSDGSEGSMSPSELFFTADNWDVPQEVTATGVADAELDGDVKYTAELQISSPSEWEAQESVKLLNLDAPVPMYSFRAGYIGDYGGGSLSLGRTVILDKSNVEIHTQRTGAYTGQTCVKSSTDTIGIAKSTIIWDAVTFTGSGRTGNSEPYITWESTYTIEEATANAYTWRHLSSDNLAGRHQPECSESLPESNRATPYQTHDHITGILPGIGALTIRDSYIVHPIAPGYRDDILSLDLVAYTSPGNYKLTWLRRALEGNVDGTFFRVIYTTHTDTFADGVSTTGPDAVVVGGWQRTSPNLPAGKIDIGDSSTSIMQEGNSRHATWFHLRF